MKKIWLLSLVLATLPWMASAQSAGDDIYYVPTKEKKTERKEAKQSYQRTVQPSAHTQYGTESGRPNIATVLVRDRNGKVRDVDEYNRRNYSADKNNFSMKNDTLYIDERPDSDLNGQWVNGFDGSQDDYEYAVRMIRFRNPAYAIPVSSPLYWDVVYGMGAFPSWDWNVYDDGLYAYVFPTFSNRLWWDWRFNSWGRWGWGWNNWYWDSWYWNDPFYYGYYGYGWGSPWWGGPYYGWHGHYHGPWYGWGGGGGSYRPAAPRNGFQRENWRGVANRNDYRGNSRDSWKGTAVRGDNSNNSVFDRNDFGGNRGNFGGTGVRPSGTVVRPNNNGASVRNSFAPNGREGFRVNTDGSRPSSSYIRPSNNSRPRSMDYSRPSSTRTNTQTRPSENRPTYQPSNNFDRGSFSTGGGGGSRGGFNTGGGSRGRR